MEYFSEIYGSYYLAVAAVLKKAMISPLSEKEISDIVNDNAFGESALYIVPKLTSGEWPLLIKTNDGLYSPVIKNSPKMPMTLLQRAWLSAVLSDARCSAFFDTNETKDIKKALDSEPLYDVQKVRIVDACSDGDGFFEKTYIDNFRTVLKALHDREILRIVFKGGKGSRVFGSYVPCRLEYSPKDDKVRLQALKLHHGKTIFVTTINLSRIESIVRSGEIYSGSTDIDTLPKKQGQTETAVIELTDERNALERFMVQFASYDKHTKHDEDTDKYICSIFYSKSDETELLIRLLSFGPVVKILSPESLVSEAKERINRQYELMGRYL